MPKTTDTPAAESAHRLGSDPAPKRKRQKVEHVCAACGETFPRRRDCFAHMDECAEIKRKLQNQRAVAPQWAVLFETVDGMTHPIRYTGKDGMTYTYGQIERAAQTYMREEQPGWLVKITDIYPVEDQNNQALPPGAAFRHRMI